MKSRPSALPPVEVSWYRIPQNRRLGVAESLRTLWREVVPTDYGSFVLLSSAFRSHYCVHERAIQTWHASVVCGEKMKRAGFVKAVKP